MGNMAYHIHHIIPIDIFNRYGKELKDIMNANKTEDVIQSYNNRIALFIHTEPADAMRNLHKEDLLITKSIPFGASIHNSYHKNYNDAVREVIRDIVSNDDLKKPQKRTLLIDMQFTLREMLQEGAVSLYDSKEKILNYLDKHMLSAQDIIARNGRYQEALMREAVYDTNDKKYPEVRQDIMIMGLDKKGRRKYEGAQNKKFVVHTGVEVAQAFLDIDADTTGKFQGFLKDDSQKKETSREGLERVIGTIERDWKTEKEEQKINNQVRGAVGSAVHDFKEKFPYIPDADRRSDFDHKQYITESRAEQLLSAGRYDILLRAAQNDNIDLTPALARKMTESPNTDFSNAIMRIALRDQNPQVREAAAAVLVRGNEGAPVPNYQDVSMSDVQKIRHDASPVSSFAAQQTALDKQGIDLPDNISTLTASWKQEIHDRRNELGLSEQQANKLSEMFAQRTKLATSRGHIKQPQRGKDIDHER